MSNFAAIANGNNTTPYFSVEQVSDVSPLPKDRILVKSVAFAANPTDWKHVAYGLANKGAILGSDVSGIVEEVGSDVTGFQKGDYVSAWVHGNYKVGQGAYQTHVVVNPVTAMKFEKSTFQDSALPVGTSPLGTTTSFEGAASLPLGLTTVGMSFANRFKLSASDESNKDSFVLIWGGATATGILAIQVAKLVYGLKVIATASKKNNDFLKSLGADYIVDYNDKDSADQIKAIGGSQIKYALDTISSQETYQSVYDSTSGSKSVVLDQLLNVDPATLKLDSSRTESVKFTNTLAYLVFGQPVDVFGPAIYPPADLAADFKLFWETLLPKSLPNIKTAKLKVLKSGLESTAEAYSLLQENKVSGEKVVWRI